MAEIARQRAELKTEIAAVKRRAAQDLPRPCTPWMRAVVVTVFALADLDATPVQKYLDIKQRAETVADVRAWYESLPPEEVRLLLNLPGGSRAEKQLQEAKRFLGEFRLVHWVAEQNESRGIAPSAGAVLNRAGPDLARQRWLTNRYRWLQQCMGRWGGRRVHFAGGSDDLPQCEFERKVFRSHFLSPVSLVVQFAEPLAGPFLGPKTVTNFGTAFCILTRFPVWQGQRPHLRARFRPRIWAPVSGPRWSLNLSPSVTSGPTGGDWQAHGCRT